MLTTKQIAAIDRLHSKCEWPIGRIERHLQISRKTIKKYLLSPNRCRIHVCRTGKLNPFKATATELVQRDPSLSTQSILQQLKLLGYKGGITTLRNHLRNVRTVLSGSNGRQEAFEWMHRLLQGAIPESEIHTDLGHVAELDKLLPVVTEERLSMRNRAIAVLAREHGIALSHVSLFLFIDRKTAWAFPIFACEKRRSHYRRVIRMAKPAQSGNDMKKLNYSCVPTALFLLECEIHTLCQAKKPLIAA